VFGSLAFTLLTTAFCSHIVFFAISCPMVIWASVVQVPVCVETCVMGWLQITTYVTDATVLRDGVWVRLDSHNLVPGDIVKVRSDWLLPCDLLLIQGNQCGHPVKELEDFPDMIAAILQWTLIMRRLFNLPNIRFWSRLMYLQ
jgi:hypothetical protein